MRSLGCNVGGALKLEIANQNEELVEAESKFEAVRVNETRSPEQKGNAFTPVEVLVQVMEL